LQLSDNPASAKALSIRASCYMKKKAWAAAVDDYTAVVALTPHDVSVRPFLLSLCYCQTNKS
jgi:hypothetical protein